METGEEIWMRYSEAKLPALVTVRKGRDFPGGPGVRIRHFLIPQVTPCGQEKKKERGGIVQG